jgi:hypothetical protein
VSPSAAGAPRVRGRLDLRIDQFGNPLPLPSARCLGKPVRLGLRIRLRGDLDGGRQGESRVVIGRLVGAATTSHVRRGLSIIPAPCEGKAWTYGFSAVRSPRCCSAGQAIGVTS